MDTHIMSVRVVFPKKIVLRTMCVYTSRYIPTFRRNTRSDIATFKPCQFEWFSTENCIENYVRSAKQILLIPFVKFTCAKFLHQLLLCPSKIINRHKIVGVFQNVNITNFFGFLNQLYTVRRQMTQVDVFPIF